MPVCLNRYGGVNAVDVLVKTIFGWVLTPRHSYISPAAGIAFVSGSTVRNYISIYFITGRWILEHQLE